MQFRPELAAKVSRFLHPEFRNKQREAALITNLAYATSIARLVYYRAAEALPAAGDVKALANYWKTYYNTPQGKGKSDDFILNFNRYCLCNNK